MVGNKLTIPGCNKCDSDSDILYLNTSNDDLLTPVFCSQILNNAGVYDSVSNTNYITQTFSGLNNCLRYGYRNNVYVCV